MISEMKITLFLFSMGELCHIMMLIDLIMI
jgi:hypothetical protein